MPLMLAKTKSNNIKEFSGGGSSLKTAKYQKKFAIIKIYF